MPNDVLRKTKPTKDYSYEALIEAKRNDPWKPVTEIIKDLELCISHSMASRIIRDAKSKKLL